MYKGLDGLTYIFSKDSQASESESKDVNGATNIQLHIFDFTKSLMNIAGDMRLVKNLRKAVEERF